MIKCQWRDLDQDSILQNNWGKIPLLCCLDFKMHLQLSFLFPRECECHLRDKFMIKWIQPHLVQGRTLFLKTNVLSHIIEGVTFKSLSNHQREKCYRSPNAGSKERLSARPHSGKLLIAFYNNVLFSVRELLLSKIIISSVHPKNFDICPILKRLDGDVQHKKYRRYEGNRKLFSMMSLFRHLNV